jgi:hypothetical protein
LLYPLTSKSAYEKSLLLKQPFHFKETKGRHSCTKPKLSPLPRRK